MFVHIRMLVQSRKDSFFQFVGKPAQRALEPTISSGLGSLELGVFKSDDEQTRPSELWEM